MDREREQELKEILQDRKAGEYQMLLKEYLMILRNKYLLTLENGNNDTIRGKSQQCRELLQLFIDS